MTEVNAARVASPARSRTALVRSAAGLLMITVAWSLASPTFSAPDEAEHVSWAAAVARLQLRPTVMQGQGGLVKVPAAFASGRSTTRCYVFRVDQSARCAPTAPTTGDRRVRTRAAGYPPLYYAIVGLPSLVVQGPVGLVLTRFMSALLFAGVIQLALSAASSCRRNPAGLVSALTPMTFYLGGAVNPSGLEIAAAVATWVCALAVLEQPKVRANWTRLSVGAGLLALSRSISPLWLLVILGILFGQTFKVQRRAALASPYARATVSLIGACLAAAAVWIATAKVAFLKAGPPLAFVDVAVRAIGRLPFYVHSALTGFGYEDAVPPGWVALTWVIGAAFAVLSFAARRRLARGLLAGAIVGACTCVTAVLGAAALGAPLGSSFWQGRYSLPLLVGAPLVCIWVWDSAPRIRSLRMGVGLMVVAQLACLAWVMARYSVLDSIERGVLLALVAAGFVTVFGPSLLHSDKASSPRPASRSSSAPA